MDAPLIVELIVIALAAARITEFVLYDSLIGTHPSSRTKLQASFQRWAFGDDPEEWEITPLGDYKGRSWFREKVYDLLTCHWCAGFWITLAASAIWYHQDIADGDVSWRHGLVVWAAAQIAAKVNSHDR